MSQGEWTRYFAQLLAEERDHARYFGAPTLQRQMDDLPEMKASFIGVLHDPGARMWIINRILEGKLFYLPRASRVLTEIFPPLGVELRQRLQEPAVADAIVRDAALLDADHLVGVLRWSYRFMPELGEKIERGIDGSARARLIDSLTRRPHTLRAFENRGAVAPLLADLAKAAQRRGVDLAPLRESTKHPRGFPFDVASMVERDPTLAPDLDLVRLAQFIEFPHRAKRRRIAADAALNSLRRSGNIDRVVGNALESSPDYLRQVLAWMERSAPEVGIAIQTRLEDDRELEAVIEACLDQGQLDNWQVYCGR